MGLVYETNLHARAWSTVIYCRNTDTLVVTYAEMEPRAPHYKSSRVQLEKAASIITKLLYRDPIIIKIRLPEILFNSIKCPKVKRIVSEMLRKRDSCGYDESSENILAEKKQKVVNGSSSSGTYSGAAATNGVANGVPVCTKEETLAARKKFIA